MNGIAYVDGVYTALPTARVSIEDRGFQFGDAVYEVWPVRDGRLRDVDGHTARLYRSLAELKIAAPMSAAALQAVLRETLRRNKVQHGMVYLQVSRGRAPRDHTFPSPAVRPTVVVTAKPLNRSAQQARVESGVRVTTAPDIRWARRDIKSVNLLANVLARQAAKESDAFEAWLVDEEGFVTEGTASNAWIVDAAGILRTRPLSHDILHGVTRATVLQLARERQIKVVEAPFSVADAKAAREAFLTGATNPIVPIIAIDGAEIGDGRPGSITLALRQAYLAVAT